MGFWDVALAAEWLDGGQRPGEFELRIRLRPEIRQYLLADGPGTPVHRFRYVRADGAESVLLICGECGHLVHAADEECEAIATAPCRHCGAGLTGSRCVHWHNWGRCLRCDEGPIFPAAGIALAGLDGEASRAREETLRAWGLPARGKLAGEVARGGVPG